MPDFTLPGWEDIFKITPESSLAPFELQQLKRERARRIAASPTPEHARNVGRFLTYTDDINDLLNAAAIVASRWVPLLARSHPLVAGAFTLARYLDLARVISPFGFLGRGPKGHWEESRFNDPYDNITYGQPDSAFGRLGRVALEALVVGQALETVTGVGLSLGPVVGVLNDLIYSTPIGEGLEQFYEFIDPLTGFALDVLADSPLALLFGQTFTPQEHTALLVGTALAWGIVGDFLARLPRPIPWERTLAHPRRPRPTRNPTTLSVLAEIGQPARGAPRWPFPGEPTEATPYEIAIAVSAPARASIAELYTAGLDPPHHELLFASLRSLVKRAVRATTPGPSPFLEGLSPRSRLMASIIESPLRGDPPPTPEAVLALLGATPALLALGGRKQPPRDVLGYYLDWKSRS